MKKTRVDLLGQRFGKRRVLALHPERYTDRKGRGPKALWLCRCDCGREHVVHGASLRRGLSKGCRYCSVPANLKHGHCRGDRPTRIYQIWCAMMQRCHNPNSQGYSNYGARGIGVCKRWHNFINFLADMGEPPAGLSIDRINNDGDYCPENCWWATRSDQMRNRRPWKKSKLRIKHNDPEILAGLNRLNAALARWRQPEGGP